MSDIPPEMMRRRREVAERFLRGDGIEIGALHHPLYVDAARARVRYVDRLRVPELRKQYPELAAYALVEVDVMDDGEVLSRFDDGSLDFIIGNHLLEHCENPLGTMRNHVRKLRPGGVLYYAVPDKRLSFDVDRPLTSFEHLIRDDQAGPECSRLDHLREWARLVNRLETHDDIESNVRALLETKYSIHFHVWDDQTFRDFLGRAREYLGAPFREELVLQNDTEMTAVLRRT